MLRALVALLLLASPAASFASPLAKEDVRDSEQQYQVRPQPSFIATSVPGTLRYYKAADAALSLSRIEFPNRPAWWRDKSFFKEIEQGVGNSAKDYLLKSKQQQRVNGIPSLDLVFLRTTATGRETVRMRFLFFRRYALVASAAIPKKARRQVRQEAKAFVRSLRPWVREEQGSP